MRKFHAKRGMKNTVQGAVYVREGSERNDWINLSTLDIPFYLNLLQTFINSKTNHKTLTDFL